MRSEVQRIHNHGYVMLIDTMPAEESAKQECEECQGKGWTYEFYGETDSWGVQDYDEKYCDCEAGQKLKSLEC